MTAYLDNDVGRVASALKSLGFWDNTLVIFHADNGGEIMGAGICGGNNWPLRGGKFSNWEGGIRVNGWVSGGVLPASRRGQREDGMVAGWDWYATYAGNLDIYTYIYILFYSCVRMSVCVGAAAIQRHFHCALLTTILNLSGHTWKNLRRLKNLQA